MKKLLHAIVSNVVLNDMDKTDAIMELIDLLAPTKPTEGNK